MLLEHTTTQGIDSVRERPIYIYDENQATILMQSLIRGLLQNGSSVIQAGAASSQARARGAHCLGDEGV